MSFIYYPLILSFPLYKTAEVIKKPRLTKASNWLIYWELFGILILIEPITNWIPFFSTIQLFTLIGLQIPMSPLPKLTKKYFLMPLLKDIRKQVKKVNTILKPQLEILNRVFEIDLQRLYLIIKNLKIE